MTELKKITTRYDAKCSICDKDIKANWTAYFQPNGKKLYCVPCSKKIETQSQPQTEVCISVILDEILGAVRANNELLGMHGMELSAISANVIDLKARIEALTALFYQSESKTEPKKTTKKI